MTSSPSTPDVAPQGRVVAEGKALRCGGKRWFLNAVSYGPFRDEPTGARLADDFGRIQQMGFNCVRIYGLPGDAMLREARVQGLKLMVSAPWTEHIDFLEHQSWINALSGHDSKPIAEIKRRIREAAVRFGHDETVAAILVGNEIEKTLVRWMGPEKVKCFLESLIDIVHHEAPQCLASYATYPST